jgi:hypothetical protein
MSKKTLFLIFILFLITAVLLAVAFYKPTSLPTPSETTSVIEDPARTTLSFGKISSSTASAYSAPVIIETSDNKVTAVQLELQFDPQMITNVSVEPGEFFPNPLLLLEDIDQENGRISYAFGINPTDQAISGTGVIANILFDPVSASETQTSIIFLPKTLVTAENITQSVLKSSINGLFSIGGSMTNPQTSPPSTDVVTQ